MDAPGTHQIQSSTLPPAQPSYILRGHTAQIHCVHFLRKNLRLLTGDADGWVVLWNLATKRPVSVWKPHNGSVLGVGSWGSEEENVITHGRDNKLLVWQLREQDEATFSKTLPIDDATSERKQPWLLHSLDVNALNFCSFAMSRIPPPTRNDPPPTPDEILLAVPDLQDGMINLTALPSTTRYAIIPAPKSTNTGMLMAVSLHHPPSSAHPLIAAGYESGHVALWRHNASSSSSPQPWQTTYLSQPHSQPVLSIAIAPHTACFFSSSADAIVARHPLPESSTEPKSVQTRHAGQQALAVRSDGRVFATAGWDGRMRVYAARGMGELAVLKWHREGCYAAAFAEVLDEGVGVDEGKALTVAQQRAARVRATHWLAAGSKDGKVSLWDVY